MDIEGGLRERLAEPVLVEVVARPWGPLQGDALEVVAQDLGEDGTGVRIEHDRPWIRVWVLALLDEADAQPRSRQVQAGDASDRPAADHDRVGVLPISECP